MRKLMAAAGICLVVSALGIRARAETVQTQVSGASVFGRMSGLINGQDEKLGSTGRTACKLKLATGEGRSTGMNRIIIEVAGGKPFFVTIPEAMKVQAMKTKIKTEEGTEAYEQYQYSFGGLPITILVGSNQNKQDFSVELTYESMNKSAYCYFRNNSPKNNPRVARGQRSLTR